MKTFLSSAFSRLVSIVAVAMLPGAAPPAHAAPGDLDPLDANVAGTFVRTTAVQPDGKTIIAGIFTSVLGVPRSNIARLNADGTLDMGFDPRASGTVLCVAVQTDGKVLLGGSFTTLQPNGAASPTARPFVARVNADGTLDTDFDPKPRSIVNSMTVQADGKVLLGGNFTTVQPNGAALTTPRQFIARVNADGTLDTDFDPRADNTVNCVAVQADGKVLLGGTFATLRPNGAALTTPRQFIARVNADGTLDTGFDPRANAAVNGVAVQADGKLLVGGTFTTLQPNGAGTATARNRIARVNADGTLDTGFDPRAGGDVHCVAVQADGKVLLGGAFTTLQPNGAGATTARNRIARVNASGTLDTGFDPRADNTVNSVAVQADGKVLLGGAFTTLQPNGAASATARNRFARLVNDPATQTLTVPDNTQTLWQRGGASPEVSRVTFELSTDGGANWTSLGNGTRIGTTADWQLTGLSLSGSATMRALGTNTGGYRNGSSGLIGQVTAYSGFPVSSNADLSALTTTAGALTPAFATATTAYNVSAAFSTNFITVTPVKANASATIQVRINGGPYATVISGSPGGSLALNVGANPVDVRVTAHDGTTTRLYTVTVTRATAAPGDIDPLNANVFGSSVLATAVQPDGKIILAGLFSSVLGVTRQNIARLNANGTLDTGFNPNANSAVNCVAVQPDGKVLLGGEFTTLQPNGAGAAAMRNSIARVNADGTLDTGFDPNANGMLTSVAVQADGKVVLGGFFNYLQPDGAAFGTLRQGIGRVNADGTLDTGFDPKPNDVVYCVTVQEDGKVLLGGFFDRIQPNGAAGDTVRQGIARVNANGTLDTGFNPNPNYFVTGIAVQADGRVLIGGAFTALQPNGAGATTGRDYIARVNADGTLDMAFNPHPAGFVRCMAVQTDGKVLLGGFSGGIARVHAGGAMDTGFNPNANDQVFCVAVQADGKVLLGGNFTMLQPNGAAAAAARSLFVRLANDPATQTLTAPDATQTLWQLGGASPELSRVTFDLSTDGGANWTPLGAGTRIGTTSNWQRTSLGLPASGHLRARGVTTGGYQNGSSGLIEQVTTFPFSLDADNDGLPDSWELTYWPATAGHGPHDDDDHDGCDNLLELAFGLNPTLPDSSGLPVFADAGGYLTITLTKRPGVIYEVQSSSITLPDSFSATNTAVIVNNATTLTVRDSVPKATGPRRFLRVMVTAAP